MDFRLGLSLLLLLGLASGASEWSKTSSRDGPTSSPRHHRQHRQVQRQSRALSEFLLPPPAPPHFRGPQGPSAPPPPPGHQHHPHQQQHQQQQQQQQQKNNNHNKPPPPPLPPPPLSPPHDGKQHTRNGRFVNPQGGGSGNNNNNPGYFSKLVGWLSPFGGGGDKDGFPRLQQQQTAQYAPHQPYTSGNAQHELPPHPGNLQGSYSNLAAWMSGKPCNPCNQIPWIPVLRDNPHSHPGQYASNVASAYLAPPAPQQVRAPDFSHQAQPGPTPAHQQQQQQQQQHHPVQNPHLYARVQPPLYPAKPFNDAPTVYSPPNFKQPPPPAIFDQPSPTNFNHQQPSNFNLQPPANFDHQHAPNFHQQPSTNYEHHQPPSNFDQPSVNFDHQPTPISDNPPSPQFDHLPSPNFGDLPLQNFGHPSGNFDQKPSQNFDVYPPLNFNHQQPPNFNNQPPGNYEEHQSNFEQHQQPSQIVGVIKEPDQDSDLDHRQEPEHAESRPVYVKSATSSTVRAVSGTDRPRRPETSQGTRSGATMVHFQRSPLIDLSVAGETSSSAATPSYHREPSDDDAGNRFRGTDRPTEQPVMIVTPSSRGKPAGDHRPREPAATLINYIVSAPTEAFGSSEEEKESRPPPRQSERSEASTVPTMTSSTTTRRAITTTTAKPVMPEDQRQQESLIETLVQSYEFYKKRNGTWPHETKQGGKIFNDAEDFSASREVITPAKFDNGKKNKQIIIPYTSQYTPSPFHPTRSINGHAKHFDRDSGGSFGGETTVAEHQDGIDDNVVIQESRRVTVTRDPPERKPQQKQQKEQQQQRHDGNNRTEVVLAQRLGNTIDVHRLQKNIDNWTIQEYAKSTTSVTNSPNSTYPRWLSSKQIPDEYLLSTTEFDESSEYYDFSNETELQRGTNKSEEATEAPETVTKVNIVNATYPKKPRKPYYPGKREYGAEAQDGRSSESERVYVVTPIPNPNSLEELTSDKEPSRARKPKAKAAGPVERAYQVLPQAVNNLAVLSSAPDSAAPALWGIMEHEEFAAGADQPRWRSESDTLPDPPSTPILYAGHSKVSRAR